MPLTLLVTTYGGSTWPEPTSKRFDREGGTIGRVLSNAFVLPDRQLYISKTHARIDFWDGGYYVTHLGKNPTELNGQELERDRPEQLSNGDRLSIGDYELLVAIEPEVALHQSTPSASEWGHDGAQEDASQPTPLIPVESGNRQLSALGVNLSGDQLDAGDASIRNSGWLSAELVGTGPDSSVPRSTPAGATVSPPASAAMTNRRNYNPLTDVEEDPSAPAAEPRPSPADKPCIQPHVIADAASDPFMGTDLRASNAVPVEPPETGGEAATPEPLPQTLPAAGTGTSNADARAVTLFLEAAGVPALASKVRDAPALLRAAGKLLREAVEGLQAALVSRAVVKRELRVDATMLAPTDNHNPFKAMPNASEVLSYLLAPHERSGYLPPLKAVHDSFEDVQAHNAAVMAGMHAALQGVLRRFDPNEVEKRLQGNSLLDNVLPSQRKARMWDLMSQMRDQMFREAEDDFDRTFGAAFRQAYNQEVNRLRSEKRDRLQKT